MSADQLMIRVYNVRFGDCLLVRIPDEGRFVHIMIDCGGRRIDDIEAAVNDIVAVLAAPELPPADRGKLDLLVLTHNHYDHIKGFERPSIVEKLTEQIQIERVWITIAMQEDHPGGSQLRAFEGQVDRAIRAISDDPTLHWGPDLHELFEILRLKDDAQEAIRTKFDDPLYVYRTVEDDLTSAEQERYLLKFQEADTRLHILAPEENVDEAYLGHALGLLGSDELDDTPFSLLVPAGQRIAQPSNLSADRYERLKYQIQQTSLLAASQANGLINNTSVVLLLEWGGLRFLFPGDAEHKSWKLMWQHAHGHLSERVDFLKVSHHGSHNGTPVDVIDTVNPDVELNQILDAILPVSHASQACAVVSTYPSYLANENEIPKAETMRELAKRISNRRQYPPTAGEELTNTDWQPQRTDKEGGLLIEFAFSASH